MYYIYILHSTTADKHYVGHSADPWQRLEQHNSNSGKIYTGRLNAWELKAVFEVSNNRGEADRIEKFIKRQKSRTLIERLIEPEFLPDRELAHLVRVPHLRD